MTQAIIPAGSLPQVPVPSVLNKQELASALRMSVRSLEGHLKAGDLPPGVRRGRFLFWDVTVVGKWHDEAFAAQRAWIPG